MSATATKPKFASGVLLATPGATEAFERNGQTPFELFNAISMETGDRNCAKRTAC